MSISVDHAAPITACVIPSEGDFSFITDDCTRMMLEDACKAVRLAKGWDFMKEEPEEGKGFMFSSDKRYQRIGEYMEYTGHSGSSYGWTMRAMQYLARNGWTKFYEAFRPKDSSA